MSIKKQYAASPYNLESIDLIENEYFQTVLNPQLFFEILLLELRSKTIAFSSALKRKEIDRVKQLESEITNLDRSDPLGNFEVI